MERNEEVHVYITSCWPNVSPKGRLTLILEKPVSFCYPIEDRQTLPSIYLTLAQFLICLLTALQGRGINLKPHHKKLALSQRRCCLKLLIFHSEHIIIKLELLLIY